MQSFTHTPQEMDDSLGNIIEETFLEERNKLFAFIRDRVPAWEDPEDVLQDVFFQFVNSFDGIESVEKVTSWLFAVARNRITDSYRKKRPQTFSQGRKKGAEDEDRPAWEAERADASSGPEMAFSRNLIMEELEEALDELPDNQREVFIWHELEDMSFKEISAMTGVSVNTLISRKRYAVLHLREALQELYEEL